MVPHSRQQSIQQSTNIICDRYTLVKLEINVFITSNIAINTLRVNDDNALKMASLALLPPLCRCLHCDAALLSSLTSSSPLRSFLDCVPHVVTSRKQLIVKLSAASRVNHRSPQYRCSDFGALVDCRFDNEYRR
jgi:hypothetical protein